jgi:DNA-binding HxlR family transcriptional regulator
MWLEIFGDRWSLLILRSMIFGNRRHFREMLKSRERIAPTILAARLRMLVDEGIITRADDPNHKQKAIYSLTEKGITLVPILASISAWSRAHLPVSEELSMGDQELEGDDPGRWEDLMAELRETHLGIPRDRSENGGPSTTVTSPLAAAGEAGPAHRRGQ